MSYLVVSKVVCVLCVYVCVCVCKRGMLICVQAHTEARGRPPVSFPSYSFETSFTTEHEASLATSLCL